jgi:hypothetical protein
MAFCEPIVTMHTPPRENANEFQQPFMSATSPGTANVIRVAFRTYRHRRIRSRRAHSVIWPRQLQTRYNQ